MAIENYQYKQTLYGISVFLLQAHILTRGFFQPQTDKNNQYDKKNNHECCRNNRVKRLAIFLGQF